MATNEVLAALRSAANYQRAALDALIEAMNSDNGCFEVLHLALREPFANARDADHRLRVVIRAIEQDAAK